VVMPPGYPLAGTGPRAQQTAFGPGSVRSVR